MKVIADTLIATNYNITNNKLVINIWRGLGGEYEVVVINLTSRISKITFEEA